jgi:hypothetical protein
MKNLKYFLMSLLLVASIAITTEVTGQGYLKINQRQLYFNLNKCTEQIEILSTINWEVVIVDSWIHSDIMNGTGNATLTISCSNNNTGQTRVGIICIRPVGSPPGSVYEKCVKVTQYPN